MTVFVTLGITLFFVFLFGLIVGKGILSDPIVIESEINKQKNEISIVDNFDQEQQIPRANNSPESSHDEILPKEDLKFLTTLKTENEDIKELEEAEIIENKNEQLNQGLKKPVEQAKLNQTFDYDVRVAAFRKESQADTLREKLEGGGFRTKKVIEKDSKGNWYFVHIMMRAKEDRFEENIELIKDFAIRDYIVKDKKAVP